MLYDIIYDKKYKELFKIEPDSTYTVNFSKKFDQRFGYKLRLKGEVGVPFINRTEAVFPKYYRKLDDSLKIADGVKTLLWGDFNLAYERTCYFMSRDLKKGEYEFSYEYKSKGDGDFKISLEAYYGEHKTRYYYEQADDTFVYELKKTDDGFTQSTEKITLKQDADFVMLKISAKGYNGDAEIKAPKLIKDGVNYIKDFEYDPEKLDGLTWMGEGFSLTERPLFSVKVNGTEIFSGRNPERLNRLSGVEFTLPDGVLKDKNTVEVYYDKTNRYSYNISDFQILTLPKEFEILGVSTYQSVGEKSGLLLYLPESCEVSGECDGLKFLNEGKFSKGVSVLSFNPETVGDKKGYIKFGNIKREFSLSVFKGGEHILTGTGDFIYIKQDMTDFSEYLSWYLNRNIGNMITFRSAYRWGVTAECNEKFWEQAVKLLCGLGIKYVLMVDGRELNGINANPTYDMLKSDYFLGEQTHEKDGSYLYWGQKLDYTEDIFYQILSRKTLRTGIGGRRSPVYNKKGEACWHYTGEGVATMKDGYETIYKNLKSTLNEGATRHTGVTPFFHTLLDAGYKWVGYESMYGPTEILLGAVRGMSKSKGIEKYGTHLALQWSTAPSDNMAHALRYKNSLYLSYMHGVTEVNTEEGLWTIETPFVGNDRFSYACTIHQKEQADFYKFIKSHDRKGKLKTDMAMILGRYDGMDCFSAGQVYGIKGEDWAYSTPEKSWDMLKVFYPLSDINSIYYFIKKGGKKKLNAGEKEFFKCATEGYKDILDLQSVGMFTSTPYGPVDIISESDDNYGDYKFLFFTGWNTCNEEQLGKLITFVENGGTLLLGKVHLYGDIDRKKVLGGKGEVINSPLVEKLLSYKDTGRLIFIDEDKYPCDSAEYKKQLIRCGETFGSKYIKSVDNVSFTEYVDGDKRIIYLLDINWWNNKKSSFVLSVGGKEKRIKLKKNSVVIVVIDEKNGTYEIA